MTCPFLDTGRRSLRKAASAVLILLVLAIGFLAGYAVKSSSTSTETITSFSLETTTITVTQTVTRISEKTATISETITVTRSAEKTTVTKTEIKTVTFKEISTVCFPKMMNGCERLLLDLIKRANDSIHVMIYSFTLGDLGDALIEARKRGVDVKVLVEAENAYSKGSEVPKLVASGVEVALDSNPYLMHNKVMIVDGKIVVTGSYNWSWSAENRNDENLLILVSESVAEAYEKDFETLWSSAEKL